GERSEHCRMLSEAKIQPPPRGWTGRPELRMAAGLGERHDTVTHHEDGTQVLQLAFHRHLRANLRRPEFLVGPRCRPIADRGVYRCVGRALPALQSLAAP